MTTPTQRAGRVLSQRYRLEELVGRGAMGAVWRAEDTTLRRSVAVKEVVLPPGLSREDRAVACERTLREARAIARLAHPNVVTLFDVIDEDERPWVVMELVLARSLAGLLKEDGPVDPARAARIGLAVLSALQAAHEVGIIHRDVKPGNILIGDDGVVKLTDFGIARAAGDMTLTGTGLLVGSPSYMAPEVIRGEDTGPAADLFGLGATLYCAVEGRPPFGGGDAMATLSAVVSDPPSPYKAAGALAPALDGLLEKDPRRRLNAAQARHRLLEVLRDQDAGMGGPMTLVSDHRSDPATNRHAPPPVRSAPPSGHQNAPGHHNAPGHQNAPGHHNHQGHHQQSRQRPPHHQQGAPQYGPGSRHDGRGGVDAPTMAHPPWNPQHGSHGQLSHDQRHPGDRYPRGDHPGFGTGQRRQSGQQSRGTATVVIAAALAIAAVLGSIAIGRALFGGDDGSGGSAGSTGQSQDGTGDGERYAPGDVPAGFTSYEDPSGFSAAVPEGWQQENRSVNGSKASVDFEDGDNGRFVRFYIFSSASGGPDAAFAENGFRSSPQYSNYQRIRMESVEYREYEAAEWEFTFTTNDDVDRHTLWRGFVVDDTLYGVYVSAPEDRFDETMSYFEAAVQTFQP